MAAPDRSLSVKLGELALVLEDKRRVCPNRARVETRWAKRAVRKAQRALNKRLARQGLTEALS